MRKLTKNLTLKEYHMSDLKKDIEKMSQEANTEPEVKLPTLEEQKAVVAKLQKLEQEGKLTPEILEEHFAQFNVKNTTPIH